MDIKQLYKILRGSGLFTADDVVNLNDITKLANTDISDGQFFEKLSSPEASFDALGKATMFDEFNSFNDADANKFLNDLNLPIEKNMSDAKAGYDDEFLRFMGTDSMDDAKNMGNEVRRMYNTGLDTTENLVRHSYANKDRLKELFNTLNNPNKFNK